MHEAIGSNIHRFRGANLYEIENKQNWKEIDGGPRSLCPYVWKPGRPHMSAMPKYSNGYTKCRNSGAWGGGSHFDVLCLIKEELLEEEKVRINVRKDWAAVL